MASIHIENLWVDVRNRTITHDCSSGTATYHSIERLLGTASSFYSGTMVEDRNPISWF